MKQHNEFESREEHESNAQHQSAQNAVQEFSTVEELLRHDAAQTSPPSSIAQRLQKSSAEFPRPNRSWWQKLFGQ
ncbi:MAG TPA: hypothetical protein VHC44_13030 [Verrucomicrobiae bacterium]|nr:hypothetical protein [Verrucomicrobiae bacterium]